MQTSEHELTPLSIHLASVAPGVSLTPPVVRPGYVCIPRTVRLSADTPADQLAQPNPNRCWLGVIANTNAVVLSRSKGDAQASGNTAATITAPNGSLIPAGLLLWLPDAQNELWVSTGTYPTLVSVFEVTRA